jgi:RNA-directed DNA polymerase
MSSHSVVEFVGVLWPSTKKREPYFEKRLQRKMAVTLKGKQKLVYLWQAQNGVCPVCGEILTDEIEWDQHHIEQRVHGGPDTVDNLVLLHPTCHRQVHSLGLAVLYRLLPEGLRAARRESVTSRS